jgi:hypothetical protein
LNCIQTLIAIRDNPKFPPITRIAACNSLLDRGYGRPVQGVAIQNLPALPPLGQVTESMTAEQAADLYAQTLRYGQLELDRKLIEGQVIDVTPNDPSDSSGSETPAG